MDIEIRVWKWSQERFGDSSKAFARLAAEIGVAEDAIREWITTGSPPDLVILKRLAEALALPVELLEKGKKEKGSGVFSGLDCVGCDRRSAMPRRPRLAAGDLSYHVLNRRVGRLPLFAKPGDYAAFETILAEAHDGRYAPVADRKAPNKDSRPTLVQNKFLKCLRFASRMGCSSSPVHGVPAPCHSQAGGASW